MLRSRLFQFVWYLICLVPVEHNSFAFAQEKSGLFDRGEPPYSANLQDKNRSQEVWIQIQDLSSVDPKVRARAACHLKEMGKRAEDAVPILLRMLGDSDRAHIVDCSSDKSSLIESSPGFEAAKALAVIGKIAVPELSALIGDRNPHARKNAVFALGIINDRQTITPLIQATTDEDWQVRDQAFRSLALKADRQVIGTLIAGLNDSNPQVRTRAAWALSIRGKEQAIEPLIVKLKDAADDVRAQAARTLGIIGDQRTIEPLIILLTDISPAVRKQAALALGLQGDERVVAPLIVTLKDEYAEVRAQAAQSLGIRGNAQAVEPLKQALSDDQPEVRKQASSALSRIASGKKVKVETVVETSIKTVPNGKVKEQ